jgi:pSer/pThr/pTyr-binding forkhead associated (FHA) protein
VTFWKRLFSADYRRALAAEAAGDYDEAARAYALAGERARVAAMHLFRAERATSPEAHLAELRSALRWADPDDADGRDMRKRIARAMYGWAKKSGIVSEGDRQVVRDAAALFAEVGDHAGAAECHELVGDELQAAEAYQKAGELERLESVLAREETRRKHESRVQESFEEYRLHLAGGDRSAALEAIKVCAESGKDAERAEYRRLYDALASKLIRNDRLILKHGGKETTYAGAFPLALGREATCHVVLRDAGISRRHAEIDFSQGKFHLRDLDSKNGTTLSGVRLGATLLLEGAGELGVGEVCLMAFEAAPPRMKLIITRGLDRGRVVLASSGPLAVGDFAELRFERGAPRLSSPRPLLLNDVVAGGAVELIVGDRLEIGGQLVEVVG